MIDKNGKVFGKINIIDLIVLIAIIAAIAVLGYSKLAGGSAALSKEADNIEIVFYTEQVSDFVADKINVGDKVCDAEKDVEFGVVTDVKKGPAISYNTTSDGQIVTTDKPDYCSAYITVEGTGKLNDYGAKFEATQYTVGHSLTIRAGKAKIYLRVYDITEKE
ncbi:MAG: DUF4330 domain-containing protein [Clostridia bacterium]|nr:DUF4330 domain-containing protein [Clostridia bacterium]